MITKEMSPEERLQYCQSVLEEQAQSGKSIREWCRENGMPTTRFHRYKRYVCGCTEESEQDAAEGGVYQVPASAAETASGETISLETAGVRVTFDAHGDVDVVCRVLKALQKTC